MAEPVLCYVDGAWAWFTTKPLDDQWGDDWDDAPYEHNAGLPYGPLGEWSAEDGRHLPRGRDFRDDGTPKWEVFKVAWDGPFETPADLASSNSRYSVRTINRGAVAWLAPTGYGAKGEARAIPAGTTLGEFVLLMEAAGGRVYFDAESAGWARRERA
jgi:hypothetical protein